MFYIGPYIRIRSGPPILKICYYKEIGGSADLTSEKNLKLGELEFKKRIISRVLRILASQNRFKSLYD